MRIIIISKYAWDDRLASGNTLSNFFLGWPDTVFFTIYCRDSIPQNQCCVNYFSVSPINIVKNIITPSRIGKPFTLSGNSINDDVASTEDALKNASKRYKFAFELVHDMLYASKIWLNARLKKYISDVNPDIVFCFGVPDAFTYQMVKYVKGHLRCPIVAYYVDDHYNNKASHWNVLHKLGRKRLRDIASMADKRYAISKMMCVDYAKDMHLVFDLLFKGCDVKDIVPKSRNYIQIIYAGNLLYNRDDTLSKVVTSLLALNRELDRKAHLDIYTTTPISKEMSVKLNQEDTSSVHGAKPYKEIVQIMREADIVLHVESFDTQQTEIVRYSFSTKITDCLQSGAMTLAIGPQELASIDFISKVPGAIAVTDMNNLNNALSELLHNPELITRNALASNDYAKMNMSIDRVRHRLQNDFFSLINH